MPDHIKLPIEGMIPAAMVEINKRRNGWTLSSVPFEDFTQLILIHIHAKYNQFDPNSGPFSNWVNRLITNRRINILRDNLGKFSPPCNSGKGGCEFNQGSDMCGFTKSGLKDGECPAYRAWKKKKESEYNIKQGLSLDSHTQEANNVQGDFLDIEHYRAMLNERLPELLTIQEFKIFGLLFCEHKTEKEVGEILKFAKGKSSQTPGYQIIRNAKLKIIKVAKKMIFEEGI